MTRDIFKERERAEEEAYIRDHDAKLIAKLRENARLEEIVVALAEKLQVKDPELLARVRALGIDQNTGAAFISAPLVQVAWAEGKVTDRERETVLRLARERGIEDGSPSQKQLLEWLRNRPANILFDTAIEAIRVGLAGLPQDLREERITRTVEACREVSEASGGIAKTLGLGSGISKKERSVLDLIASSLRGD